MSLIMDALEKIQREQKEPKPEISPSEKDSAAVVALDASSSFKMPPGLSALYFFEMIFQRVSQIESRRWAVMGMWVALTLGVTVFLFQQNALQFMPPVVSIPQILSAASTRPAQSYQGVLRGIVQDPSGGFCLIGENILKKGDTWHDYQVVAIGLRQVTLKNKNDHFLTLTLRD